MHTSLPLLRDSITRRVVEVKVLRYHGSRLPLVLSVQQMLIQLVFNRKSSQIILFIEHQANSLKSHFKQFLEELTMLLEVRSSSSGHVCTWFHTCKAHVLPPGGRDWSKMTVLDSPPLTDSHLNHPNISTPAWLYVYMFMSFIHLISNIFICLFTYLLYSWEKSRFFVPYYICGPLAITLSSVIFC